MEKSLKHRHKQTKIGDLSKYFLVISNTRISNRRFSFVHYTRKCQGISTCPWKPRLATGEQLYRSFPLNVTMNLTNLVLKQGMC